MVKKLKLKKRSGKIVPLPQKMIKRVLSSTGFTGKLLLNTVGGVLREASRLATAGVVTAANLEKAIVKAVYNSNRIAMNSAQRVTKKVLK